MKKNNAMRAVTVPRYGGPEVLRVAEIPRPTPGPGEVLVRVAWGAVNAADRRLMRADPWLVRLAFGIRRPRFSALGIAMSGTVAESNADQFHRGDRVAADLSAVGCGGFAEFVCVPGRVLAHVPDQVDLEVAATLPLAATTALQAIRNHGHLQRGGRMLVTGASGAVGLAAVELGRSFGAEVWALTSAVGRPVVEKLKPAYVVDRTQSDVTTDEAIPQEFFHVIIDTGGYRSIFDYRLLLAPRGIYVHVGGSMRRLLQTLLSGAVRSRRNGQKWKAFTATADVGDLEELLTLAAANQLNPPIAARYPLAEAARALLPVQEQQSAGRVLIDIR